MTPSTVNTLMGQIDNVATCSALAILQAELNAMLAAGSSALSGQIEKLTDIISDSNPVTFVTKMISAITDTIETIQDEIVEINLNITTFTSRFLAQSVFAGCVLPAEAVVKNAVAVMTCTELEGYYTAITSTYNSARAPVVAAKATIDGFVAMIGSNPVYGKFADSLTSTQARLDEALAFILAEQNKVYNIITLRRTVLNCV